MAAHNEHTDENMITLGKTWKGTIILILTLMYSDSAYLREKFHHCQEDK